MARLFLKLIFIAGFFSVVFVFAFVLMLAFNLPTVKGLKNYRPIMGSTVYSSDMIKIAEFYKERRVYLTLDQIPKPLIDAFLAAEDSQFYQHSGISFSGIFRAFLKNMVSGEMKQGGSTITQQVAKGILLSPEKSIVRKIKEAFLATRIEKALSKERILEIYLNQIFFGQGAYGVEAASEVYFEKNVKDLSLAQMAMLAGLIRAPSRDNPKKSMKNAIEKQRYVLKRMLDEGFVGKKEYELALQEVIKVSSKPDINLQYAPYFVENIRKYLIEKYPQELIFEKGLKIYTTMNSQTALAAKQALENGVIDVDTHQGYRGPIENVSEKFKETIEKISIENQANSTEINKAYKAVVIDIKDNQAVLDLGFQKGVLPLKHMAWARKPNPEVFWEYNKINKVSQALKKHDLIEVKRVSKSEFKLYQSPLIEGALLSIHPHTGAIMAMVGGFDFEKSEFNRTMQARRQPGSAFKPIIFSAALDRSYTAASIISDTPIVYEDDSMDESWKPKNYAGEFHGDTIFRDCLVESRNIPTIKIVQDIGVDYLISYAKKMGITSSLQYNLSIALGSSGVLLSELASAYSVFATGGRKPKSFQSIIKIEDLEGNVLEQNEAFDSSLNLKEQLQLSQDNVLKSQSYQQAVTAGQEAGAALPEDFIISPQTAFIMTNLLKQVITAGTGSRAKDINRPAAGKTGTTNENHDAWFVGYTPNLLTVVWLGFDDSAKSLGAMEDGGRIATPIWLSFMKEALKDSAVVDFNEPDGLIKVKIDKGTGKLASPQSTKTIEEYFLKGTEPGNTQAPTPQNTDQFFLNE